MLWYAYTTRITMVHAAPLSFLAVVINMRQEHWQCCLN